MDARAASGARAYRRVATPAPVSGRRVITSFRPRDEPANAAHAALRSTVDIILQSSGVELFHENGMAVAPLAPCAVGALQRYHETVALLNFAGPGFTGALTLSIPQPLFAARASDSNLQAGIVDWVAELSNQLFGRLMNRLAVFQLRLKPQLPIGMSGPVLERLRKRTSSELLYRFRTVRGDILVTLDAPLDDVTLAYSGSAEVAHAGDIILF